MTLPSRSRLASWRVDEIEQSAADLEEVRNEFIDLVGLAATAPERADASWSGEAADACRERVLEEGESARKLAHELEDVVDKVREVGRRLGHAKAFTENTAVDIESDPHSLLVSDSWAVNISPMALLPVPERSPELVRGAIIERQEQMDAAVRFLVDEDAACATLLAESFERAAHCGRQLDQAAAFRRAAGRMPENVNDWLTASMLDPFSEDGKYRDVEAGVVMGHIRPEPGRGSVRTELYIPVHRVFNMELIPPGAEYDLGDHRGSSPTAAPGDARVELVIDYENGVVVARQNPSATESGEVRADAPTVEVQQLSSGDVRVAYEAVNPFAPLRGEPFHKVHGEVAVSSYGDGFRVGGVVGEYPSLEIYHHRNDGSVEPLVIEEAEDRSETGPLWGLPRRNTVGDSAALEPFVDTARPRVSPHEGAIAEPSYPGETRLGPVEDGVRVPTVEPARQGR